METQNNQLQTVDTNDIMMQSLLNPAVFEQMQRSATLFSKSGLIPKTFQDNMPACFVGLQLAAQLGINPFMLFQRIYTPGGGKIGIESQVAVAIANAKRLFKEPLKYVFTGDYESKPVSRKCVCVGILSSNGATVEMPLTWKEVEDSGWNKKDGNHWIKIPDKMFMYRTALWLIRHYAPELLLGLSTIDELQDAQVIDITPEKPKETVHEKLEKARGKKVFEPETAKIVIDKTPPKTEYKAPELTPAQKIVSSLDPLIVDTIRGKHDYPDMIGNWSDQQCSAAIDEAAVIEAAQKGRGF